MKRYYFIFLFFISLVFSGCLAKVDRASTSYYVLDYQSSTEDQNLVMRNNYGKSLYVSNSRINRTYNRNQIVVKENFYKVRFLPNDLWANRLSDAVPSLIAQRLSAYNIFTSVSREAKEHDPDLYLETNIQNMEKIEGSVPYAFLRMEFVLKDAAGEKIILTHRNERYQELMDDSIVYLVQVFNNMIMEETNIFAAKYILHASGRTLSSLKERQLKDLSAPERIIYERMEEADSEPHYGELLINTKAKTGGEMQYRIEELDSLNTVISEQFANFNESFLISSGRYRAVIGQNEDIMLPFEIHPRQRAVLERSWSELRVRILDLSQNKVRYIYDIWEQNEEGIGYSKVGSFMSLGEDEHGIDEKLWILPAGNYMITLSGYSWSDLRDFATVCLKPGDSHVLTVIVDPASTTGNILVGAGILADELAQGGNKAHRGAIHANLNLTSNNEVKEKDPTFSLNMNASFDNTIDQELRPFHFNLRSIYDVGANLSKEHDFRINFDSYSLKNVLLFYPWGRSNKLLNNFALYGRADLNTHFWDEYTYFSEKKNYKKIDKNGYVKQVAYDQERIRTKIATYPLRMKEGGGITYRLVLSPKSSVSLRGGYGWQQDLNNGSFSFKESIDDGGKRYDIFVENEDKFDRGIEATLIFSTVNILNFVSLNSTVDALIPIDEGMVMPRIENENRFNIRIYRNVSLDLKLNLHYDESAKPWWIYDYSTFLRMSLFY